MRGIVTSRLLIRLVSGRLHADRLRLCHHVVRSPYSPVCVPPVSITDFVWAGLGALGDRPALLAADSGDRLTYAELRSRCRGLAGWLQNNLPPHAVVALLLPNSAEFAVVALGALESGHVVSALHADFTEEELVRLFRITDTGCVFTVSRKIFTVLEAKSRLEKETGRESSLKIVSVDREVRFSGVEYLDEVVKDDTEDLGARRAEDPALLLDGHDGPHTLSHASIVASCRQVSGVTGAETTVAALPPMCSQYGLTQVLLQGLSRGATLVTMGRLKPEDLVRALKQHGVTSLPAAAGLARYLASGHVPCEALAGLRSLTLDGPLPQGVLARLLSLLPGDAELAQLYAPAHGSAVFHQVRDGLRPGSVGRPLPSTEAKVIDSSLGEKGACDTGEICVRGPQLHTDAWMRTGELGYYDAEGYFYVTGRVKESERSIPPVEEVEAVLEGHPELVEAAVLVGDEGALVGVVVPREPSHSPHGRELINYASARLPASVLSNVVFVDHLPRLHDGCLDRRQICHLYSGKTRPEVVTLSYI